MFISVLTLTFMIMASITLSFIGMAVAVTLTVWALGAIVATIKAINKKIGGY